MFLLQLETLPAVDGWFVRWGPPTGRREEMDSLTISL